MMEKTTKRVLLRTFSAWKCWKISSVAGREKAQQEEESERKRRHSIMIASNALFQKHDKYFLAQTFNAWKAWLTNFEKRKTGVRSILIRTVLTAPLAKAFGQWVLTITNEKAAARQLLMGEMHSNEISKLEEQLLESKKLLPTPLTKNITTISQAPPAPDQDEAWLDQCINEYQKANTTSDRNIFEKACVDFVLDMIKQECIDFNVPFDQWFSEKSLVTDGSVDASIQALKSGGHIYEKDGAVWFKSQALGDDKDRVLVKANGDYTYFATDIAYHWHKLQSKPDNIIDIMGADHHGYIPRLRAALIGLGMKPSQFHAIIYQFITLTQNGQQVQMSTRQGSYITLADLIKEVGLDCARFYLLQKKPDQHITFDLNIAKKESLDNPVYKIHYAHARICSVLAKLTEKAPSYNPDYQLNKAEKGLIQILTRYPDVLASCARDHTLHHLCQYLLELASQLHSYYSSTKIIQEDLDIQASRHYLILCIAKVIRNGIKILGLKAKDKM